MRVRALVLCVLAVALAPAAARADPPVIGANYTHYSIVGCSMHGTGIVAGYDQPDVRATVRFQLAAMRGAGLQSLRLILWHTTDISGKDWGVVPSAGGVLPEPYRTNLVEYLADVRDAGFRQLTVSFAPAATNDPRGSGYDPRKLDENLGFIDDVRPLIKEFGPASTHVDLINEGAPRVSYSAATSARVGAYIAAAYTRYVQEFGNGDVVVSAIRKAQELQALVRVLLSTGIGAPSWFEIHPSYTGKAAYDELRSLDRVLSANGLDQPLVIGEAAYDDIGVAAAIGRFLRSSSRQVAEVLEWPLRVGSGCKDVSATPPYSAGAYLTALASASPASDVRARGAQP